MLKKKKKHEKQRNFNSKNRKVQREKTSDTDKT